MIPKWYHLSMHLPFALTRAERSAHRTVSIRENLASGDHSRAVLERFERSGHDEHVAASTLRMIVRWATYWSDLALNENIEYLNLEDILRWFESSTSVRYATSPLGYCRARPRSSAFARTRTPRSS